MTKSKSKVPVIRAKFKSSYLGAASIFAAKTDVRYYLNGIYVEPVKGGGVNLVATDGHRMIIIHDKEGYASRGFIIPNHKALYALCKKRPKVKRGAIDPESVTSVLIDGDTMYAMKEWYRREDGANLKRPGKKQVHVDNFECSWPFKEIEGKFPDFRNVIAKTEEADGEDERAGMFAFNPHYVRSLCEVQKIIVGATNFDCVMAKVQNWDKAIMYRFDHPDMKNVFAMIMPMRFTQRDQFVPGFAK